MATLIAIFTGLGEDAYRWLFHRKPAKPVTVTADVVNGDPDCSPFVVAQSPRNFEKVISGKSDEDVMEIIKTRGAPAEETLVDLTVQGATPDQAVQLTDLRVIIESRGEPRGFHLGGFCEAALAPRGYVVDLDRRLPKPSPVPVPVGSPFASPEPSPSVTTPPNFPYKVSSLEAEYLRLRVSTTSCDCLWHLELDWNSQGASGTIKIDDLGKPFHTISSKGLPHYDSVINGHLVRTDDLISPPATPGA
ncbi:hypothetical protein ABZ759_31005 [Streptomyces sp. NPDC047860]|uniref:hypothetical protein n=1 Tax=Streptomyces sp. NPDC047860 TaxID=3155743 RepID=UPI003407D48B